MRRTTIQERLALQDLERELYVLETTPLLDGEQEGRRAELEEAILLFNPYHGAKGLFSTASRNVSGKAGAVLGAAKKGRAAQVRAAKRLGRKLKKGAKEGGKEFKYGMTDLYSSGGTKASLRGALKGASIGAIAGVGLSIISRGKLGGAADIMKLATALGAMVGSHKATGEYVRAKAKERRAQRLEEGRGNDEPRIVAMVKEFLRTSNKIKALAFENGPGELAELGFVERAGRWVLMRDAAKKLIAAWERRLL